MDVLVAVLNYSPDLVLLSFCGFIAIMRVLGLPMEKWRLRR